MTWLRITLGVMAAASGAFAVQTAAQDGDDLPDAPAGDAGRGRDLYMANSCHACHGSVGQGGGPGPALAATSLPFEGFAMQMREPAGSMPAYGDRLLGDQDLADVYAYLKALPGPQTLPDILRSQDQR